MELSNNEIRHSILEILYEKAKKDPMGFGIERPEMLKILGIPENIIDFNIKYLEEKNVIRLENYGGAPWGSARITSLGIDVIEDKEKFKMDFPFINTEIHFHGDNYENIVQATGGSTVNFSQQVSDAFKKAYDEIEAKEGISVEQKDNIKENTKLLEGELNKTEPDAGRIQQTWKWLKQNAGWIVPTLIQVVSDGIKIAYGVP